MQFAEVDGNKVLPYPGAHGVCPMCGSKMIAKCGVRVMHHWAHFGRRNCDPWWENETKWHRSWKHLFPVEWLEVSHIAPDGEVHRADIKTPKGIVVEVQHSAMSDAERLSREVFYQNLVWVIDGRTFEKNFDIYHLLPSPESKIAAGLVWVKAERKLQGTVAGLFFRLSECQKIDPSVIKANATSGWIHSLRDIENQVNEVYRGHHQYDWVRPRTTWLDASRPVYIDFGNDYLVKLGVYDDSGLRCIRLVSKAKFVNDVMTKDRSIDIGEEYLEISESTNL